MPCVRLTGVSPTANIDRRDVISWASEPARYTHEFISGLPVLLSDMLTSWARARSIPWIDKRYLYSMHFALVSDELPKLVESPRAMYPALSLSYRYPVAYALQILQSDTPPGALGFQD